jgi:hypothetical protein
MKAFPTAIPAVAKRSIVPVCAIGNANMLNPRSARPVMAILFSVKLFTKGPINAP